MGLEQKRVVGGSLKTVSEGKARVRLARLLRVDLDNDVLEPNFFPSMPPLVASIQPFHKHDVPSLGHARVRQDTARGEVIAEFEFNDTDAAQEMWKVLAWDAAHEPSIQEFSWAFRVRDGAARQGMFEGRSVRFLGPAPDGGPGLDLVECGPVLRGASIGSGTLAVRSRAGLGPMDPRDHKRMLRLNIKVVQQIMARQVSEQAEARAALRRFQALTDGMRRERHVRQTTDGR